MTSQITAHVCLSRVKMLERMRILQPFSAFLFSHGNPVGPARLARKLSGRIAADDAIEERHLEDREGAVEEERKDPMATQHLCASCYLQGEKEYMLDARDFGFKDVGEFYGKCAAQGGWTRCLAC